MKQKYVLIGAVVVLIVGVFISYAVLGNNKDELTSKKGSEESFLVMPDDENIVATIVYDGTRFSPASVEIKKGETVLFLNKSSVNMWVASNPHPAHTILSSFDQFVGSKPGTTYQYTFDEIGTWRYHDHINPNKGGMIVVTEPEAINDVGAQMSKNAFGYFEVDPERFSKLVDDPKVTVVNVHVPYSGEIAGTDIFVPYNETDQLLASLPKDKDAPIALYCRSGGMSAVASKDLVAAGYTNVYDLSGGMNAYKANGREVLVNEIQ